VGNTPTVSIATTQGCPSTVASEDIHDRFIAGTGEGAEVACIGKVSGKSLQGNREGDISAGDEQVLLVRGRAEGGLVC
jgi:hypothetical protein